MNENQICEDYRRSGRVSIAAQLNGIPNYIAAETLFRHGYPVKVKPRPPEKPSNEPKPPTKKEIAKQQTKDNKAARAAQHAKENERIKELLDAGLSMPDVGLRTNLSSTAVFYRKMEIYEPEKYREHLRKCCERQSSRRAVNRAMGCT